MLFRKKADPMIPPLGPPRPAPDVAEIAPGGGGRTVVGAHTLIRGTLKGDGPLLVRGTVEGEIAVRGGLTVAPSGRVEAEVEARSVELEGEVRGSMRATARVALSASGIFEGEMATPVLEVRPGSIVRGRTRVAGLPASGRDRLLH
jgi:cytoskeletal protein CcmA (bactofilin family)